MANFAPSHKYSTKYYKINHSSKKLIRILQYRKQNRFCFFNRNFYSWVNGAHLRYRRTATKGSTEIMTAFHWELLYPFLLSHSVGDKRPNSVFVNWTETSAKRPFRVCSDANRSTEIEFSITEHFVHPRKNTPLHICITCTIPGNLLQVQFICLHLENFAGVQQCESVCKTK